MKDLHAILIGLPVGIALIVLMFASPYVEMGKGDQLYIVDAGTLAAIQDSGFIEVQQVIPNSYCNIYSRTSCLGNMEGVIV